MAGSDVLLWTKFSDRNALLIDGRSQQGWEMGVFRLVLSGFEVTFFIILCETQIGLKNFEL